MLGAGEDLQKKWQSAGQGVPRAWFWVELESGASFIDTGTSSPFLPGMHPLLEALFTWNSTASARKGVF
jgi:hypothetical protein